MGWSGVNRTELDLDVDLNMRKKQTFKERTRRQRRGTVAVHILTCVVHGLRCEPLPQQTHTLSRGAQRRL